MVRSVTMGCSGAVLMYGATGSGKTWTMTGGHQDLGLVQRSVTDLFAALAVGTDPIPAVSMSILEIYNEVRASEDCLRRVRSRLHCFFLHIMGVELGMRAVRVDQFCTRT